MGQTPKHGVLLLLLLRPRTSWNRDLRALHGSLRLLVLVLYNPRLNHKKRQTGGSESNEV